MLRAMSATALLRLADPYADTMVIDRRAPRTNQAFVAVLTLAALLTGWWWLASLMGLQLLVGLVLGRRWCLPCRFYFDVLQPRLGEGELEDSRLPRFANVLGASFLLGATALFVAGLTTAGWVLVGLVAALATLAAVTGFCTGCWMYRLVKGECDICELDLPPHLAGETEPARAAA
jgi:hypothetical protein